MPLGHVDQTSMNVLCDLMLNGFYNGVRTMSCVYHSNTSGEINPFFSICICNCGAFSGSDRCRIKYAHTRSHYGFPAFEHLFRFHMVLST